MVLILVFAAAFLAAVALAPVASRLSPRLGTVDQPSARRVHTIPTPRFGGLPLFVAFFVAVAVSLVYPRSDINELPRLTGLFLGALVLFLVGAYDDHRELSPFPQLLAQAVAAVIAVASGVLIREVQNPFGGIIHFDMWFAVPFTLFWIIGMTNTVNWLDGVDGLASGVVAIAGILLLVHTIMQGQLSISLLALALIGTALGFLVFNFPPARIFMGTAGALVLGFELGVLSVIGSARVAFALLVLGIPILDVAWQIISRVRAGKSPFYPTRTHLHHRLLDAGISPRLIVLGYYVFTAISGLLALVLPLGFYKLIALIVIGIGGLLLLLRMSQLPVDAESKKETPAVESRPAPNAEGR